MGLLLKFSNVVWSCCFDISCGSVFCSLVFDCYLHSSQIYSTSHPLPLTPLHPFTSPHDLHIAHCIRQWRIENSTKLMVVVWLGRVLSAPLLHILNTLRGVFHFILKWGSTNPTYSPLIKESHVLLCISILGRLMYFIWVWGAMEGSVRTIFELFHILTWPSLMHSLIWVFDYSSLAWGGCV